MFSSFPSRFLAVIFGLAPAAGAGVASPVADNEPVLVHAHAHNDYLNHHPLTDALDNGFTSVEADVWLARPGGELVLCHEEKASDGKPPTCDNGTSGKGASSFEATYLGLRS